MPGPINPPALGIVYPTIADMVAFAGVYVSDATVYVQGNAAAGDGGGGVFRYDPTDTTSAANGRTLFVDGAGHRMKLSGITAAYLAKTPHIEDFGSNVGTGDADADQAAFAAAKAEADAAGSGLIVLCEGSYQMKTGLFLTGLDGMGFISETNRGRILQKTGTGEFDWNGVGTAERYGIHHTAFNFDQCNNVKFHGITSELEANVACRATSLAVFRGCPEVSIDTIEGSLYSQIDRGFLCVQSCSGAVTENVYLHDTSSAFTLTTPQITVIEVDNDQPYGNSLGCRWRNIKGSIIEILGAAAAAHGQQTDVLNIQTTANVYHSVDNVSGYRVGEVLDNFSSGMIASNIHGDTIYGILVKLGHRASYCEVNGVRGRGTGGTAVYMYAAVGETSPTEGNVVKGVNVTDVGQYWNTWTLATTPPGGVTFDSSGATSSNPVKNNYIEGQLVGYDAGGGSYQMLAVVGQSCATGAPYANGNKFDGSGANYYLPADATSGYDLGVTVAGNYFSWNRKNIGGAPVVNKRPRSQVAVYPSANVSLNNGDTFICDTSTQDTNSEYNTTTGIFTSRSHQRIQVTVQMRLAGLGASNYCGFTLSVSGVDKRIFGEYGDGLNEIYVAFEHVVLLVPGDTIKLAFLENVTGAVPVTGGDATKTFVKFTEIPN